MKKNCITLIMFGIIVLVGIGFYTKTPTKTEYLRIHIRADSNLSIDQEVKYKVKDEVVEYLTPKIAEATSKEKAEKILTENLEGIEEVANKVLSENGFSYKAKAKINNEKFPVRVYGTLTLDEGYYDALIINLGSGKGDNWWCVVYPPLCFTESNGTGYVYRSKIYEIIEDFYKQRERK